MERRSFDRRFVVGLLILLLLESFFLARHLRKDARAHAGLAEARLAGHIVKNENELRRRAEDSLVWEEAKSEESVYYYDSLLTLTQSTASLSLFNETEVHLSENTLVTIEPLDERAYGEIRLRFSKGSFQARNPYAPALVQAENWSLEIKTGSEIDFRQVGDGNYELSVDKGEAEFSGEGRHDRVGSHQLLRIEKNRARPVARLDKSVLTWRASPPRRIYIHGERTELPLTWSGAVPASLVLQSLGRPEETRPLVGNVGTFGTVELPLGQHRLYLRSAEGTSSALDVEIWRAPRIHLLVPRPRDRVQTASAVDFLWMRPPGVASFVFKVNGAIHKEERKGDGNSTQLIFGEEEDAVWSVEGRDSDGFLIPSPYTYPIYIRDAPLSAPKLRVPLLRRPASDRGASLWQWLGHLILPEAQAEEAVYEVLLSWEPVEKADHYLLEVSATADFRELILSRESHKNEFTWKRVMQKTFYWRVAAGSKKGRLGFFSEPALADLESGDSPGLVVQSVKRSVAAEAFPGVASATDEPESLPAAPPPFELASLEIVEKPKVLDLKPRTIVEWRPAYRVLSSTSAQEVRADLSGATALGASVEWDRLYAPNRLLQVQLNYTGYSFKPAPANLFPFQNNLRWFEASAQVIMHMPSTHLGYGLALLHGMQFSRQDYEAIGTKDTYMVGITADGIWHWGPLEYLEDYTAYVGTEYGLGTEQRIRYAIGEHWFLGLGFNGEAMWHKGGRTYSGQGELSIGCGF